MNKFCKVLNDSNIEFKIYHGWNKEIKKWFIDLQLPQNKKSSIIEWFDKEENFLKALDKIL